MTTRLLSLTLGRERYAIDLACVKTVLTMEGAQRVPDTPPFLMGLIPTPLGVVPLVDLARKFRLPAEQRHGPRVAVVVEASVGGKPSPMAILAGETSRVVEVAEEDLRPAPELGAGIRADFLRGVVALEDGTLPIIDIGPALSATEVEAIEGLRETIEARRDAPVPAAQAGRGLETPGTHLEGAQKEYLVFSVSDERMALPLAELRELAQHRTPAPVPGADDRFLGVVNVRGEVIPVLDVAIALGLPTKPPTRRTCHLILEIASDDTRTAVALLVDEVRDVVSQTDEGDRAGLELGLRIPAQHVCGVARVAGGFVPVIDPATLLPGLLAG